MTESAAKPESDEELVRRFQRTGALDAADELVRRHAPGTRRVIRHMLLSDRDVDDLTQEVFVRAFRAVSGFDGRARFSTWLYRIALNTTRTYLARRRTSPLAFTDAPPDRPEPENRNPARRLLNLELDKRVTEALNRLSPKLRAAVVLTMIEGRTPADAARIEGCLTATFYWRLHQARKLLQQMLRPYLEGEECNR